MSISEWSKPNDTYIEVPGKKSDPKDVKKGIPEGIWSKCAACGQVIFQKEFFGNYKVCPDCGFHYPLSAHERLDTILDAGTFKETDAGLRSMNPLGFTANKTYEESLETSAVKTGMNEAVLTGTGKVNGRTVVIAVLDFRFIGGSMGSVVGEKVTRAAELAAKKRAPFIAVVASGGARMQEGMFSLAQMAKTSAALGRLADKNIPYISIMTHPTTGGVTASFPALADVIIAEPGALIGFTGARVIEDTLKEKLPEGFQTAEFMLAHGMIDMVTERKKIKGLIATILDLFIMGSRSGADGPQITVGDIVPGADVARKMHKSVQSGVKKSAKNIKTQVKKLQGK
jgi:acetyl-CoA carboxylase carboxyl transferase subunit beta